MREKQKYFSQPSFEKEKIEDEKEIFQPQVWWRMDAADTAAVALSPPNPFQDFYRFFNETEF